MHISQGVIVGTKMYCTCSIIYMNGLFVYMSQGYYVIVYDMV